MEVDTLAGPRDSKAGSRRRLDGGRAARQTYQILGLNHGLGTTTPIFKPIEFTPKINFLSHKKAEIIS